jgi:tetratricopeptide (TPR) repeat protein
MAFQISSNLYPLLFTNYLVRKLVFQCLQYKAKSSECDTCAQRAAFELAFCYHIGLGVERSPQSARYWAHQSGEELETLEDEMDEVIDIFIYQNKKVIELGLNGFSMIMDHVNEYRQADYDLEVVQTTYKREIKDLTVAFEEDPLVTVTLRATLGNILQGAGKFGEAEELYKELISFFDNSPEHGSASPSALTSRHYLANLFREQGRLSEAEELIEAIVNRRKGLFGSQNPDVLDSMATLGSILYDARKLEKATTLFRIVRETSAKVFGDEHPRTLIAMSNLACACRDTGLLHEAEELDLAALTIKKRLLDDGLRSHYSTLTSMANLALTYSSQGRWDKAEELETQVIEERSKTLGDQHHATLTARGNLAQTYYNQGRLEEAKLLQEQVLEGRQQVLGNDHPQTLIIIDQLAKTHQSLRHIKGL